MPHSVIDRRIRSTIADAQEGNTITLEIVIDQHQPSPMGRNRLPYRIMAHDPTGKMNLVFSCATCLVKKQLPEGKKVIVSGKAERFNGHLSMIHPDYIIAGEQSYKMPWIEPIYPSTTGLSIKTLRRAIQNALDHIPLLPEWIEENVKKQQKFCSFHCFTPYSCTHRP